MKTNIKKIFKPGSILMALCLFSITACEEDDDQVTPTKTEPAATNSAIVLPCDYFATNSVLKKDSLRPVDYIIDCFMLVDGDQEIMVEPGVVIEFGKDAGIYLTENAQLKIEGSEEAPITLTGTAKGKGHWRGIYINTSENNSIKHTKIEYAAGKKFTEMSPDYLGTIAVASGASANLSHVEISKGANLGLDLSGHSANVSVDHLSITENEGMAVRVCAYQAHIFDSSSTFVGNAFDYINIIASYYEIEETVSWEKLDVPYLVDGRVHIKENGSLTIEHGVEAQFRSGAYLQAAGFLPPYNVTLKILGTSTDPVRLSAYNGTNWGGIYYSFTQQNNLIKHAIIEGAKGDISVGNITNTGAIYMHADPKVTIEDTEFKDLPNCAYYAYTGASTNQPPLPNFSTSNITLTNVNGNELCWGGGRE